MFLYIDPGTGSMLFTILIGVLGAGIYAARNLVSKLKFTLSGGRIAADKDRTPFVIFTDSKRYWNIFKPICDELEKRGQKTLYLTASNDDPALESEYEFIKTEFAGDGNKAFARMNMIKADVVLSTTPGLDVYQWKRSRDVLSYIHIPHAASDLTMYRMFGIDYYDAVMVSGQYHIDQIRALEELRGLPKKDMPMIGITYMDTMKERLENAPPIKKDKTTVLLAPSWGESAIFKRYGGKVIDELLKTEHEIIVRPHPQSFTSEKELMDELMKKYPNSERLTWDRSTDNFEVLRRSDILISDFSGVMFDYALVFDKPIIYTDTSFDPSVYDAWWLKEEPWTFKTMRALGMRLDASSLGSIGSLIEKCLSADEFRQARDTAREEAWQNRGNAAKLAVDYMIETRERLISNAESELTPVE